MNQRRRVRVVLAAVALSVTGGLFSAAQANATAAPAPTAVNASNPNPAWVCVTVEPNIRFCQRNPLKPLED